MLNVSKLKKEFCLGRLIWIQPPGFGSALFFTKKLFNEMGLRDQEMIYLSARQFIQYSKNGFSVDFLKGFRMIMVGEIADLTGKMREDFVQQLAHHKNLKLRFDVSLVLVSEMDQELAEMMEWRLDPYPLQIFSEHDPIEINEKIHDFIESASDRFAKPICKISIDAANSLERIYIGHGENYVKRVISRAVQGSKNKTIAQEDLDFARQFVNSFEAQLGSR